MRLKAAIGISDARHFAGSSAATAALGISPKDLINNLESMGLIFENLRIRDLRAYADALDGNVYRYRDKTGLECDAAVHLRDGRIRIDRNETSWGQANRRGSRELK